MGVGGAYGFHAELNALGQGSASSFAKGLSEGALEAELLLRMQSGFGENFDQAAAMVAQWSKPPLMLPPARIPNILPSSDRVTVTSPVYKDPVQIAAKFKHAADFGVTGSYNRINAVKFEAAIDPMLPGSASA